MAPEVLFGQSATMASDMWSFGIIAFRALYGNVEVILDPAPGHGGKINYEAFIEALHRHGYDGWLTSEYCLPVLRDHKLCGIEDVDAATRRGLRYMKQLVERISAEKKPARSKAIIS